MNNKKKISKNKKEIVENDIICNIIIYFYSLLSDMVKLNICDISVYLIYYSYYHLFMNIIYF